MKAKVNLEKLKARAADIRSAIEKIQTYTSLSETDFWADERNIYTVKYLLLQAMEALGSICVHVLARRFQVAVSNYASCFQELEDKKVISPDLSKKLRKMIRFRNIMVHRYWEVDDKRVLEYARNDVQDMLQMLKAVWEFIGIDSKHLDE